MRGYPKQRSGPAFPYYLPSYSTGHPLTDPSLQITFAMQVCYMISLAFTKISILVLYLRILTYHYARWFTWSILVLTVVYNIVGFCVQVTTCIPLKKLWEPGLYGKCHSITLAWALIGLHVGTDFLVFALPIPIIITMTMPLRQKLLLIALFSLGFLYRPPSTCSPTPSGANTSPTSACAVSLIRTIYLRVVFAVTEDPSWDSISMTHWNGVEVNIAIVCACLMTMKPLIEKLWPRLLDPTPEHDTEGSVGEGGSPGGSLSARFKGEL